MILSVSAAEVAKRRARIQGAIAGPSWRTNYLGTFGVTSTDGPPLAFRVDMGADTVTKPHFHEVDQFQVFLDGCGRLGRHEITKLGVHYADHHSAYGPVAAGNTGFSYLTLRPRQDSRIIYSDEPGSRQRVLPGKRRQYTVANVSLCIEPVRAARDQSSLEPLFEAQSDGLAAFVLRLGAGMSVPTPDTAESGGMYIFVANGCLVTGRDSFPTHSLMWVSAGDAIEVMADETGLEALLLRFPMAAKE